MSDLKFNMNLVPRDRTEVSKFINFKVCGKDTFSLKDYNGKIIYSNISNPDKHIYHGYYVYYNKENVYAGKIVSYKNDFESSTSPLFSLEDIKYDDLILFNTQEFLNTKKK